MSRTIAFLITLFQIVGVAHSQPPETKLKQPPPKNPSKDTEFFRKFLSADGINTCNQEELTRLFGPKIKTWFDHFSGHTKDDAELKAMADEFAGMVALIHKKNANIRPVCTIHFSLSPALTGPVQQRSFADVATAIKICPVEEPQKGADRHVFSIWTPCAPTASTTVVRFNFTNSGLSDITISGEN